MTHSTHLYTPTQSEIDHAAETLIAAIAAESETVTDAGRLTDECKAYFAGRLARIDTRRPVAGGRRG